MTLPKISPRERNLLVVWAVCVAVFLAIYFWPERDTTTVNAVAPTQQLEKRLVRLRRQAAGEPDRKEALKRLQAELAKQEKGLIRADTAAQAQAQMVQIVRKVAAAQTPAVVLNDTEFGEPHHVGNYGEVVMTIATDCGIEQIVNFLVDLSNLQDLVAVTSVQLGQANGKKKVIPMRLTFTGMVPGKLVPEKKAGSM
jgi:hypothetical protein